MTMAHIRDDLSTGRRIYVQTKFGEPVVEKLKDAGCKWDAAAKCWWAGAAKRAAIEAVLVQRDKDEDEGVDMTPKKQTPDDIRLTGKGKYKGREYYAGSITKDGTKVRLLTLPDAEGKYLDFWAHCSEVQQTKTTLRRARTANTCANGITAIKICAVNRTARGFRSLSAVRPSEVPRPVSSSNS